MKCKIILRADSVWAKRLGLDEDTEFEDEQELIELLNDTVRSKTNQRAMANLPGITKMLTHQVSNLNAGIQQDATHATENSNVILPSQMFNAFTFKGYSQAEVNEIYNAIADIAVRGLSDTFFKDPRPISEIKQELIADGTDPNLVDARAKEIKNGSEVDFSVLIRDVVETDNPEAKREMLEAFREILIEKGKTGEEFGLFEVLTQTFNALDMPIDNPHMFNTAVSELANKFSKEAIKIKFDGQFAVLKPGSGSQQVYEITGGLMPYRDGMTIKTRPVVGTEIVTRERAAEWSKLNNIDLANVKRRNLQGQYVTIVDSNGNRQQLTMAQGEQLIPEAKAISVAKELISEYKGMSKSDSDHEALYKKFLKDYNNLSEESGVKRFVERYINEIPDDKLKKEIQKGSDPLSKIFKHLNPESNYFPENGSKTLTGDKAKLLYFAKLNTLGKVLTHELNKFMSDAAKGLIPESIHGDNVSNLTGHKIEISRAEVIVDLTARDKFLIREGDDIGDINEELFYKRLLEKSGNMHGVPYHGAERAIQSGETKILFHYGVAPGKYDVNKTDQAEWDPIAKVMNVYGTPEGGTANKLLFSLQGETSVRMIDGNMHIFLNNDKVATDKEKQTYIVGKTGSNYKRVEAYFAENNLKAKTKDLTKDNVEEIAAEKEKLATRAKSMFNSWNEYLNVIGTRIPGQHYQSFQGLKIVGFASGNKVFVPNEVTMLAGSDFDIDKMNMIYYSIDNDGLLSGWHPKFDRSSKTNMDLSMKLPLPIGRTADAFLAEYVGQYPIDDLIVVDENFDIENLNTLISVYEQLKSGRKLGNDPISLNIAEKLAEYDDKSKFKITPKAINNFTISRANTVINNPKNYPLLQKPVSMASPQLMGSLSKEGKEAKERSKEQPSSVVLGKIDNMVGKDMIGITASSLKAFSGMTAVYNKALMDLSKLSVKMTKLVNLVPQSAEEKVLIDNRIQTLQNEINMIKDGFPPETFSVANLNYDNLEASVLDLINPRFETNDFKGSEEFDIAKQFIIQNMMEGLSDDAAEITSELLSAATDNAKELILSKIRATPEFGTIYTSLITQGVPFWKIVEIMTNPTTDFFMKHFDKEPFKKEHNTIDGIIKIVRSIEKLKATPSLSKRATKRLDELLNNLSNKGFTVEFTTTNAYIKDKDGVKLGLNDLTEFGGLLNQGKEIQILGKYLGINQGIKANAYELYSFTRTIESHLFDAYGIQFNFTKFLNSLNTDKQYANEIISELNESTTAAFNLLFVLANATNFEKQLQGFSVTNQMLVESTYKMNGAYGIAGSLSDYALRQGSALNEDQFNEVQRYIDNVVLLKFFDEETKFNNDPSTRPVFYDGENRIQLTTVAGRKQFAEWVHNKFIPSVKRMEAFKNNEFVRDLTYETVPDRINAEALPIVRMTYDTTNAISEETKSKADNYKFNLNLLRYGYDKDSSLDTTNNIFNVLFWYNTLINKGGTGKYSWAKMQNELIMTDENHPFRRLAELQGELGKDTSYRTVQDGIEVNGILFKKQDLLVYHNINDKSRYISMTEEEEAARNAALEGRNQEPDYDDIPDYENQDNVTQDFEATEGEEQEAGPTGLFNTTRFTRKGIQGTRVKIFQGTTELQNMFLQDPLTYIPYDITPSSTDADDRIAPADSARAMRELGDRFTSLNPDIILKYPSRRQLIKMSNDGKFDFTSAKAFVLNGEVNVNLNRASISDLVHEYAHIFLHTLKYESLDTYNSMIQLATNHPRYDEIQKKYSNLGPDDLNEEVFVTLFGEAMREKLGTDYNGKELLLNFADYTKGKLSETLNRQVDSLFELSPKEVANLSLEEAINLLGDDILRNRIENIYNQPLSINNEIAKLKDDLFKLGLLTEYCG